MHHQEITSEDKLRQLLASGKITVDDYERLLKAVNQTPSADHPPALESSADEKPSRLLKSRSQCQLGGVCSGLGTYLNVEPYLIRLIVLCLALVSSSLVMVSYLALYLYLPWDEPKVSQKTGKTSHVWLFGFGATILLVLVPWFITTVFLERFVSIFEDLGGTLPPITVLAYTIGRSFELNQHHVQIPWGVLLSFKAAILGTMGYLICHNNTVRMIYTIVFFVLSLIWSSLFLLVIYYTLFSLPKAVA